MDYKKISQKREETIAKELGGRSHPGSGNQWYKKGDVSSEFFLIEDKFTTRRKYSIQLSVIRKLTKEANGQGKTPVLRFGFEGDANKRISFACIEDCYCLSPINSSDLFITDKKSKVFYIEDLYKSYIGGYNHIALFTLTFRQENRNFFIFEWSDFLENYSIICAGCS